MRFGPLVVLTTAALFAGFCLQLHLFLQLFKVLSP